MFPGIISYNKSMPRRLEEFRNLLSDVEAPCSEINEVWSSFAYDLMLQNFGWQALWVMSEEYCNKFNLLHPTAVIVTVEYLDWGDMSATVSVTAVQDDIVLPASLDVPVIDLYPLKDQAYDEDDLNVIADWLDKCRYFFKYLWYPWDKKINVKICSWCNSHLKNRLQIQCDIQNGKLCKNVVQYYNSLVAESRCIDAALSQINSKDLSPSQRGEIIHHCIRRKILKFELNFFEEPELRNDLMLLRKRLKETSLGNKKEVKFVWKGGSIDRLLLFLSSVKSNIGTDINTSMLSSLEDALLACSHGDKIMLPPGSYFLKWANVQSECSLEGLWDPDETEIHADHSKTKKAILFECYDNFEVKNLTIMQEEGTAVQVFEHTLRMFNCRLKCENSLSTRGITVLPGCTLVMEKCEITGFGVGIALQSGAKAVISNTTFRGCMGGIKVNEDSELSLKEVEISNCSEYGLCFEASETNSRLPTSFNDSFDLSVVGQNRNFSFDSVSIKDNKKRNVLIKKSSNYFTTEFYNGDSSNETVVLSDDE